MMEKIKYIQHNINSFMLASLKENILKAQKVIQHVCPYKIVEVLKKIILVLLFCHMENELFFLLCVITLTLFKDHVTMFFFVWTTVDSVSYTHLDVYKRQYVFWSIVNTYSCSSNEFVYFCALFSTDLRYLSKFNVS